MGLRQLIVACIVLLAVAPACGGAGKADEPITVLAAASMTDVLNRAAPAFTAEEHVPVRFSFGPSSALVKQIGEGAPVDVLITADDVTMDRAVKARDVAAPVVFARNELQIAVAPRNPHRIRGVADLSRPDLIVVACQAEAPCGRLAGDAFRRANANVRVRSFEPDVSAVLAKVRAGEADAGLVYVTSVRAASAEVDGVALGPDLVETAPDVVAVAARSKHRASAAAFVRFLLSPAMQARLRAAGFAAP